MKLFDIFAKRRAEPLPREQHVVVFPQSTDSGIYVNDGSTMGCTIAEAAGSLVSRTVAMLPTHVQVPDSDQSRGNIRLPDHPVEVMLQRAPNPEMTAMAFKEFMFRNAVFNGGGYAEIERDQAGRPYALWPIRHERVDIVRDGAGALFYEVDNGTAGKVYLPPQKMLHLKGPTIDGISGLSVIGYARNTLGLAIAQERFAANFIRNQAAPSGLIKVSGNISPDGMKRLKAEIEQLYAGPRRAGRIVVGDETWAWQPIGVSPQDAEFLEQRRFSVEEICRVFGVPPQLVGDTSKQTFANFEQAGLNFLGLCILPWVIRLEQEINVKLLNIRVAGRLPFVKLNTSAIVRANVEAQTRAFALGRQWGWYSVNDVRRLLDLEPIGPEGDRYETTPGAPAPPPGDDEDQRRTAAMRVVK